MSLIARPGVIARTRTGTAYSGSETWFIDSKDSDETKKLLATISLALPNKNERSETVLCQDGIKRPLWKCPDRNLMESFEKMADMNGYPYSIYVRENANSPARLHKVEKTPPQARPKTACRHK